MASILIGGIALVMAMVGMFCITIYAWRRFARWIAKPHVAKERRRTKMEVARIRRTTKQREKAMLRGASVVATRVTKAVVEAQLKSAALREDEHWRREARLLEALVSRRFHEEPGALESLYEAESDSPALSTSPVRTLPTRIRLPLLQTVRSWLPGAKGES